MECLDHDATSGSPHDEDKDDVAFQFAQFSIDRWMRNVPGGYLANTQFGHAPNRPVPPEILEDGPLQQIYLIDLALFIGAERTGVKVAAMLASMAPDESSMIFLASQVLDEARHFEAFAARFRQMGLSDEVRDNMAEQFTPPSYRAFLDSVVAAADAGDFEAGLIGLNVILEGMAFPLYEYEVRYWKPFDPGLAEVVHTAYLDECRHVGFGEKRLAHLIKKSPQAKARIQKKVDEFSGRLQLAFDEFLAETVTLYDMAVREFPERAAEVEIIPGKSLLETPTDMQIRWLEKQIQDVHRDRLNRIGLDLSH